MATRADLGDYELEPVASWGSASRHAWSRLEPALRSRTSVERFLWGPPEQMRVGTRAFVPDRVGAEFTTHGAMAERHEGQAPRALVLEGAESSA